MTKKEDQDAADPGIPQWLTEAEALAWANVYSRAVAANYELIGVSWVASRREAAKAADFAVRCLRRRGRG